MSARIGERFPLRFLSTLYKANSFSSIRTNLLGLSKVICLHISLPILPPAPVTIITLLNKSFSNSGLCTFCFLPSTSSIAIGLVAKLSLELIFESFGSTPKANPFFCAKTYNFSTDSGLID